MIEVYYFQKEKETSFIYLFIQNPMMIHITYIYILPTTPTSYRKIPTMYLTEIAQGLFSMQQKKRASSSNYSLKKLNLGGSSSAGSQHCPRLKKTYFVQSSSSFSSIVQIEIIVAVKLDFEKENQVKGWSKTHQGNYGVTFFLCTISLVQTFSYKYIY